MEWDSPGKRKSGRPNITWNEGVTTNMEKRNIKRNMKGEECLDRDM